MTNIYDYDSYDMMAIFSRVFQPFKGGLSPRSDEYGEGPRGPKEEEQLRPPPGSAVAPVVRQSVLLVCRSLLGKVLTFSPYCCFKKRNYR